MSLAELKESAAALSPEQRLELVVFLAELEELDAERYAETVNRRMAAMDAGRKVSMQTFEAEHQRLKQKGQ